MPGERYFAFIPQTTLRHPKYKTLAATTRVIYTHLVAERHGVDLPFKKTYAELHQETGFSTATLRKAVMELKVANFLEYEKGGLERNPNRYRLMTRWLTLGN